MGLAHHFPGLQLSVNDVNEMTPETTAELRKAGDKILKRELKERLALAEVTGLAAAGVRTRVRGGR